MNESSCRATRELLPWYLNRSLDETERREVEQHLASCPDCRRELEQVRWAYRLYTRHLPAAAVLAYAAGAAPRLDLGGGATLERATADEHLAACAECRDEVAMARESLAALEQEGGQEVGQAPGRQAGGSVVPFAPRRRFGAHSTGSRRLALAASLLFAVVAAGGWLTSSQQASEHAGRVAELERRLEAVEAAADRPQTDPGRGTAPGEDPLAGVAAQVEALTATAGRLQDQLEEEQQKLAALQDRSGQPRLAASFVPPLTVRGGAQGAAPEFRLDAEGATLVFSVSGVSGTQAARIRGDGRLDLGTVEVPSVDEGTPVLTLHLPPGTLEPGDYVLELPGEDVAYPFRLVAAD